MQGEGLFIWQSARYVPDSLSISNYRKEKITTATITNFRPKFTCPTWCESIHDEDPADVVHYGPQWRSLPIGDYPFSVQTVAFSNEKVRIKINVETPTQELTPEQAIEAGRYLIEAGTWAMVTA
jgi:hypothetical protein